MTSKDLLLMAYVDGALGREGRRIVERRLKMDERAREDLRRLQQTAELARMALDVCAPTVPAPRVMGCLMGSASVRPPVDPRRMVASLSVCVLVLAAVLLFTLTRTDVRWSALQPSPGGALTMAALATAEGLDT